MTLGGVTGAADRVETAAGMSKRDPAEMAERYGDETTVVATGTLASQCSGCGRQVEFEGHRNRAALGWERSAPRLSKSIVGNARRSGSPSSRIARSTSVSWSGATRSSTHKRAEVST
jgi:hypothetical protein